MKKFASLFLAAVLGSVSTIVTFEWIEKKENGVKLEYVVPTSKVSYKTIDNGQTGLDFAATAEKVTPAVVYIRSTQESGGGQEEEVPQGMDPFREFFGPRQYQQGPSQSSG